MKQRDQAEDWIGSYLDWSDAGWTASLRRALDGQSEVDYCAVYLEWMDAGPMNGGRERRAMAGFARGRRASDVMSGSYGFREAVLLAALHAQTDCLHILREVVGNGSTKVGTLRLAAEALEHAQRLIDDERLAKRALDDLQGAGTRRESDRFHSQIDAEWPRAIEHVVADVRSLANTVLAMQFH
jgi:hypothetical protein